MFLWTIEPMERIFPPKKTDTLTVKDGFRFIEMTKGDSGMEVSRLISTDPRDYLKAEYSPGSRFTKQSKNLKSDIS